MNGFAKKSLKTTLVVGVIVCVLLIMVLTILSFFDTWSTASTPPINALYLDKSQPIDVRVADLLSYMNLEEKIGQMTLVEKDSVGTLSDVSTYHLGGLLSGSGSKPETNSPVGWREIISEYQAEAAKSRLGIPLLYGSDAVHGHGHVPGMTVFPHAIGLGATHDAELVSAVAAATAEDLRFTGVNWSYAPNLDIPQDIRWGRVYETFSDDPLIVATLGAAYVEGMQSASGSHSGVLAGPKHFIGLGGMQWGSSLNSNFSIDQGVTPDDETLLRTVYLPPFQAAIDAGALSVMVGLNTWGDSKMVLQKHLLTDVLKEEMQFKGFLVSDWYGVHEGRRNRFLATVQAVNAGVDMVMLPFDYQHFVRDMKWANRLGLVSDERINDAVGRILYAKFSTGLFDVTQDVKVTENPTVPTHDRLAREAVTKSLVLLQNEGAVLPLSPAVKHIQVAGSAADNVGQQMGGWSIEWQGVDGNWPEESESILSGIKARALPGVEIEYDELGIFDPRESKAEVGIAVVGEMPYAEGWGDNEYPTLSEADVIAIKNLRGTSKQVVVVVVSGRPLIIEAYIDLTDALVVAWLPGSAGGGVADGLFGDTPFTGTLPIAWPLHVSQLPISPDGTTADGTNVLFPRGFGL